MTISLIIVNYFSAEHTRRAIASARAASTAPLHVVVVDNSVDPAEAELLQSAGADVLCFSTINRGYAGGLNDGIALTDASSFLLSNPDVIYQPGSIDALMGELGQGVAMTGPRFFWDDELRFMHPPAELPRPWRKRFAIAATETIELAPLLDLMRFRERMASWVSEDAADVEALSGAVMAVRRDTLRAVGPFDERFALYFEETDYMQRCLQADLSLRYVPASRCRHLYNQSAQRDASAASMYVASEVAYFEKWFGSSILRSMARAGLAQRLPPLPMNDPVIALDGDPAQHVIELSPLRDFTSAAGHFPETSSVRIPPDILASVGEAPLYARVLDRESGTTLSAMQLRTSS